MILDLGMRPSFYDMPFGLPLDETHSLTGNLCIFLIVYRLIGRCRKSLPPHGSEPELGGREWTDHARSGTDSILSLVPLALIAIYWVKLLRLHLGNPGEVGACDILVLFGIWAGSNYLLTDATSEYISSKDRGHLAPLFSALSATFAVAWYLSSSFESPGSEWVSGILTAAAGIALSWSALPTKSEHEGESFRWAFVETISAHFVISTIAFLRFLAGSQINSFLARYLLTIEVVSHGEPFPLSWLGNRVEEVLLWALYAYVVLSTWTKMLRQIRNFDDQRAEMPSSRTSDSPKMFTMTFGAVATATSGLMLVLPEPSHILVWLSGGGFVMLGCVALGCRSEAVRKALWAHEYRSAEPSLLLSSLSMKHSHDRKGRPI